MDILTLEARDIGRFIRINRERAKISSFPEFPRRRRHVHHLTQGELAELVGVSTIVISQIEQARYPNVNAAILKKIAKALRLTWQQEHFLIGLLTPRPAEPAGATPIPDWARSFADENNHPVMFVNPVWNIQVLNNHARTFLSELSSREPLNDNLARMIFLEEGFRDFIVDWEDMAANLASSLRMSFSRWPDYRSHIEDVAADLSRQSEEFNELWMLDDPLITPTVEKEFLHPSLGQLNTLQVLTEVIEAPMLLKIDFLPADDETRAKFEGM